MAKAAARTIGRRRGTQPLPAAPFPLTAERADDVLRALLAREVGAGRLAPWMPVAFGAGVVVYLAAGTEPSLLAAALLATALAFATFRARKSARAMPGLLLATLAAAGFLTATLKTALMAHPVLDRTLYGASITGVVEARDERERSDRIVVRIVSLEAGASAPALERIRVSTRKGNAPAVGTHVAFKARLLPPTQPLRPGAYDFARDFYLRGIGATGFVLGTVKPAQPDVNAALATTKPGVTLRLRMAVENLRDSIDRRIRSLVAGDAGLIASALITGKANAISTPVRDALFVSGLGHVLSISGYHMAIVAGLVFFAFRAGLALVPAVALRRPVKKWAALGALAASAFYLVLSGAEVATQRSFVMIAVVLVAVMLDRQALTLRTLAVAAFAVLIVAPESVAHPSFQMSFAATLALVAMAERAPRWFAPRADAAMTSRLAVWSLREITMLLAGSLLAGLATAPFVAFHFHRFTPYGTVANLLAMPVVSALVMPAGIAGMLAMPFGLDAPFWRLMGWGVGVMNDIAIWCAAWPGALLRLRAFGEDALLLAVAGMLLLGLLRGPLRWSGMAVGAAAIMLAWHTPQPDILVSGDGMQMAVRRTDGRLSIARAKGGDAFTLREWLAADADDRTSEARSLAEGVRCDEDGCTIRARDGALVSLALTPAGIAEDCDLAQVVATPRTAPPACAAVVIDRTRWKAQGAQALFAPSSKGARFEILAARPPGYDRPWAPARPVAADTAATPSAGQSPTGPNSRIPNAARDAEPSEQDTAIPGD